MEKENKIEFNLDFGGFYHSVHSDTVDSQIEQRIQDFNDFEPKVIEIDWDNINYKETYNNYASDWLDEYSQIVEIDLEYIELNSPREYNFTTDKIIASIKERDFIRIKKEYLANPTFVKFVNENSKSRSGFHSFYSGIDNVVVEDDIFLTYLFRYITEENIEEIDCIAVYEFEVVLNPEEVKEIK